MSASVKDTTRNTAIEALRRQIQKIAFDANLFDMGLADYPHAEECSRKRKKLLAAIEDLRGNKEEIQKEAVSSQQLELPML